MTTLPELQSMGRATVLHPFTHAKDYAAGTADCFVVESGEGVRIKGADGTELIDAFGGLYCVNVGYGRSEVADAIAAQARKRGLITRTMPHADILGFAPPLVLTKADADQIVAITRDAVNEVTQQLKRERTV